MQVAAGACPPPSSTRTGPPPPPALPPPGGEGRVRGRHLPGARPARRGSDQPLQRRPIVGVFVCPRGCFRNDGSVPFVRSPRQAKIALQKGDSHVEVSCDSQ